RSLAHPHSQLIGLSFVPRFHKKRHARMRRHFEHGCRGRNLVAEIVAAELRVEQRIITSTAGFVAFVPFASGYPYEIWIAPRAEATGWPIWTTSNRRLQSIPDLGCVID